MPSYTDQVGNSIEITTPPKRIVSLVPSQTELLFDLGLDEEVVGITKFCVHPQEWFRTKKRIGGTKQLHPELIRALKPDLIIANKEENVRDQVEELANEFPVWTSDVNSLDDAYAMIYTIGNITGRLLPAQRMISRIMYEFSTLPSGSSKIKAAYLIWKDPYMAVGSDTFINNMLACAGFENIFSVKSRYPEITVNELHECEVLLLSSEPFPFSEKHVEELEPFLPGIPIVLADGELFSWYGSRLIKAPAYFQELQNEILSLKHAGNR
jgi:ABC-type Fe3+-hydroxamate transport system substrate-binding protein